MGEEAVGRGGIKSIQRGLSSAATVTINAVDEDKTVVISNGNSNASTVALGVSTNYAYATTTKQAFYTLTNSTTITNTGGSCDYQVVEYY